MTATLSIITLSVAALLLGMALVLAFFPRVPVAVLSFSAMFVASLSGMVAFTVWQMCFWAVATVIASFIAWMDNSCRSRAEHTYIVCGALVGAVLGLAIGSEAAVIMAAAAGGFLGFEAFRRTPSGRNSMPLASNLNAFAAVCLPAVVNFSILMLIFAQLIKK